MKKKVSVSLQKFLLSIFLSCIAATQLSFAQDCKTLAANKPSTLSTEKNEVSASIGEMSASEMAKRRPYLAKAEKWVKNIVANFTGAKMVYFDNFYPDFVGNGETHKILYQATGIKSFYSSKMQFFAYYCYDNRNTIFTEDESGSNVQVVFNNVFTDGFTNSEGVYTINAKPAFRVIQKKRSEGRIDFYELRTKDNATAKMFTSNDFIILRNSDKPVFIPVTRKEYLQQMLKDVDISGTNDSKLLNEAYESNKKLFEMEMKVYKEMDKSYTPEKEAKRRKWFEEDQEKLKKTISKTSPDAAAAKEVILQYLQKPTEWLNRTVSDFYSNSYTKNGVSNYLENLDKISVNGVGEVEEYTLTELATINPAYFNKIPGSEVPQVIMVQLRGGGYAHMQKVAALVKKAGALAPLEAVLNPN